MSHTPAGFHDSSRKLRIARFNWIALVGVPLAAILFQVYVPRFITYLAYLELPLLVTVYFPLMRRSPVMGVFFGAGVGLTQDSLSQSHHPLGMFGIVNTLVGYFAASVGQRFEVENSTVRLVLAFFFSAFIISFCGCWQTPCSAKQPTSSFNKHLCWASSMRQSRFRCTASWIELRSPSKPCLSIHKTSANRSLPAGCCATIPASPWDASPYSSTLRSRYFCS